MQGYADSGGELPADWETLYACNNGRLEWLEYNLKRVLGIDCGDEESEMGMRQVEETIQHIAYYAKMREQILEHCMEKIIKMTFSGGPYEKLRGYKGNLYR